MPELVTVKHLAALLLVSGLLVGSLASWFAAVARRLAGLGPMFPAERECPPRVPWTTAAVGWGVLGLLLGLMLLDALVVFFAPGIALEADDPFDAAKTLRIVQFTLVQNTVLVGILLLSIYGARGDARALGLHLRAPLRQGIDAVVGFFLAIGPVFAMLLLSQFAGLRTDEAEHEFLKLLTNQGTPQTWFWVSLAAVVAAPLTEELLFRVVLQTSLEDWLTRLLGQGRGPVPLPAAVAIGTSSILFCAVHNFPDSLALLPLALLLGFIYQRRRSYPTVVLIHALFNASNLLLTAMGAGT
jgi:membrane protease YdiL (CAAX protease family)